MMAVLNLRGRKNFPDNCLTPAVAEGFVKLLHPDSPPGHPRPKYLLTVKGPTSTKDVRGFKLRRGTNDLNPRRA